MDEIIIGNIKFTPDKRILNKGGVVVKMRNKESEVLRLLCHHYPSTLSREDLEKILRRKYGVIVMLLTTH